MRQKDEAKAQEILRATLDEVQAVGLAGLSIEAVARRAGVATGTVYTYFKGKGALLDALYLKTKRSFADFIVRDENLPLRAAFERMVKAYMDYVIDHYAELIFMTQMANSPYLTDETRETAALAARPALELLERGKAEHLFKDIDSAWLAAFVMETLKAMAALAATQPKARRAALQDAAVTLCWDALKA
ncbi:TetR/AcrR family transcriptional regulator [Phenylobacterium sp.]|uniref:TetR/AcrR family transcriptional regulator n=1 Tax=Phenylobacterium sp. TaxID=1871053 RepID=UPI0035B1D09E